MTPKLAYLSTKWAHLSPKLAHLSPKLAHLSLKWAHLSPQLAHLSPKYHLISLLGGGALIKAGAHIRDNTVFDIFQKLVLLFFCFLLVFILSCLLDPFKVLRAPFAPPVSSPE